MKLKVKPEGRPDMWLPEKESLKEFIAERKLEKIHNFIPSGFMMMGADHDVKGVMEDIDKAETLAVFTSSVNMGHSLALITNNKLECYDIGEITIDELAITN